MENKSKENITIIESCVEAGRKHLEGEIKRTKNLIEENIIDISAHRYMHVLTDDYTCYIAPESFCEKISSNVLMYYDYSSNLFVVEGNDQYKISKLNDIINNIEYHGGIESLLKTYTKDRVIAVEPLTNPIKLSDIKHILVSFNNKIYVHTGGNTIHQISTAVTNNNIPNMCYLVKEPITLTSDNLHDSIEEYNSACISNNRIHEMMYLIKDM